jgi:hypothetical protein
MAIEFRFKTLTKFPREPTPYHARKDRPFIRAGKGETRASSTPLSRTYDDLRKELGHLRVDGPVVIEIALAPSHVRVDGLLRADAPKPRDPGVVLRFEARVAGHRVPLTFVCDDCTRWEDNLRAIVLTLERLRLADLYGVTKGGEQYKGWAALPGGGGLVTSAGDMTPDAAARLIHAAGVQLVSRIDDDDMRARAETAAPEDLLKFRDLYKKLYQLAAFEFHPDQNGQRELPTWRELGVAKKVMDKHHGG